MAGESKKMASNPGQVLKNHQKLLAGKIKRRLGRKPDSYLRNIRNWCDIPNAATLFKHAEESMIRIVQ